MTERGRISLFPLSLFFLSLPPLSVCLSSVCRRNTLLYLHPNDPSSGPRGWALYITQRSIRARARRLLCPIINPYQLSLSLSLPPFSHMCPSSAPPPSHNILHVYHSLRTHNAQTHRHTHLLVIQTNSPSNAVETHTHFVNNTHTIYLDICARMHRTAATLSMSLCGVVERWRMSRIGPQSSLSPCDSISALLPGKAAQRPGCEMYILLTELGVHKALVAANHTDIKAQWFSGGWRTWLRIYSTAMHLGSPFCPPRVECEFWLRRRCRAVRSL